MYMEKQKIIRSGEIEYRCSDESGDASLLVYHVFDGVDIIYNSVHMMECDLGADISGNLIEIHHCREGRFEHEYGGGLVYLLPGDLSVSRRNVPQDICQFPMRHYHGITIIINEDIAPKCFSCLMKDVNLEPSKIADKLCGADNCFLVRKQDYVEHIFSELYSVPDHCRTGFFKIKILELMFVLSWLDPSAEQEKNTVVSVSRAKLARETADYLIENQDRRVPVEELVSRLYSSETLIRRSFKAVYGVSPSSFMRVYKIQSAALKLTRTGLSVAQIAGECGYDNPSKFASAFREIMGETPLEYRKAHSAKGDE